MTESIRFSDQYINPMPAMSDIAEQRYLDSCLERIRADTQRVTEGRSMAGREVADMYCYRQGIPRMVDSASTIAHAFDLGFAAVGYVFTDGNRYPINLFDEGDAQSLYKSWLEMSPEPEKRLRQARHFLTDYGYMDYEASERLATTFLDQKTQGTIARCLAETQITTYMDNDMQVLSGATHPDFSRAVLEGTVAGLFVVRLHYAMQDSQLSHHRPKEPDLSWRLAN